MSNINVSVDSVVSCFEVEKCETPFGNYFTESARDGLVWWGCENDAWKACYYGYAAKVIDWGFPLPDQYYEEKGLDVCRSSQDWDSTHRSY